MWRRKRKQELEEELRAHLEAAVRERIERGESRADAEAVAQREFGNVNVVRETTHDVWGWASVDALLQDLRYAVRTMAAKPTFHVVTILVLALGIGANAAIFGLWHGLLFAPLPGVEKPEELVILSNPDDSGSWSGRADGVRSWLTYAEFVDLRDRADLFSAVMATQSSLPRLRVRWDGGEWEEARGRVVSGGFFQFLGARTAMGRVFTAAADQVETPEAVISYAYWHRRFGGRPDVLGKSVIVGNQSVTVIGVTAAGFIGETMGQQPDLWLPLRLQPNVLPGRNMLRDAPPEKAMWLHVFGRLKPGVTLAQAEAQANSIFRAGLESFYGEARIQSRPEFMDQRLQIQAAARGASSKRWELSGSLNTLLIAASVLLLIVCTNLANLLLARGLSRRAEMALRLSLGASRGRLLRQLGMESLTLAAAGGAAAVFVANFLHGGLVRLVATSDAGFAMTFRLDPLLLIFISALTLLAALLFGILPAWHVTKTDAASYLKEHSRGTGGSAAAMRPGRLLVSLQLALSLPLLAGAGLLMRTTYNLQRADLAFPAERLLLARVDFRAAGYAPERREGAVAELTKRIAQIPGVAAVSFSHLGVFTGGESSETIEVEGYTPRSVDDRASGVDYVGPGYFSTLGVPMLLGREIRETDTQGGARVCVVNEAFVQHFIVRRNPIGMRLTVISEEDQRTPYEIVGVTRNARTQALRGAVQPRYFAAGYQDLPMLRSPTFLVRTGRENTSVVQAVRKAIEEMDASLPILSVRSIEERKTQLTAQERAIAQLAVAFGGIALCIAAIGLYGVLSYGVARRSGEIAIRIALGARPGRVVIMILRETAVLVGFGLALGGGLAYGASRLIENQLYGVAPQDPLTLGLATALLILVAGVAALLPARKAAGLDPMAALRHQ